MNIIQKTDKFDKWFRKLRDINGKGKILARLKRAEMGNLGDVKSLGVGLFEMRIREARCRPIAAFAFFGWIKPGSLSSGIAQGIRHGGHLFHRLDVMDPHHPTPVHDRRGDRGRGALDPFLWASPRDVPDE